MTRQSLADAKAFAILAELEGKKNIQEITDIFDAEGLIPFDPAEQKREMARDLIGRYRKRCVRAKDVQGELVNLTEDFDDGTRADYYKRFDTLTIDEGAQLLTWCNGRIAAERRKFYRYFVPLRKKHGRKLQRMLAFPLPERPEQPVPR